MDSFVVFVLAAIGIAGYITWKSLAAKRKKEKLGKWAEKSRQNGKVILHGMYGNNDVLPTVSPFVLKLESYLRFANIPYEIDKSDIWGEKGKTPWISFDGRNYADSQFIVKMLSSKVGNSKSMQYSKEEKAIGTLARVMVEEHLYWTGVMWRFAFGAKDTFQQVRNGEKGFIQWLIFICIAPPMKSMAWSQGVGRHSESEVIAIMLQDLHALSGILGSKQFILGDEPCEDDCAIFAGLAAAVFMPNSPQEVQLELKGDLKNLTEYCHRIKGSLWPDWDSVIEKSKSKHN